MAFDGSFDGAGESSRILMPDGFEEVADKAEVASAMAGALVFGNLGHFPVPYVLPAATEIVDGECAAVSLDVAGGAHDAGPAASERRECLHREGGGLIALEHHFGHIVVRLVVVAMIDAASVTAVSGVLEALEDHFRIPVAVEVEYAKMGLAPAIDVDCGIRAGGLVRAAVGAMGRSAFRGVLGLEEMQACVCNYTLAGLVQHPAQDVEVVAGLGEDDGGGLLGIAPVAAHV